MESSRHPTIAKKLWHIFQVVYYMLRKGMPKRKLIMMDLHLLLKRGKIAGKALGNLMTSHHHHHSSSSSSIAAASSASGGTGFSCRSMDPNLSFYNPRRDVEFSCSNTPSYPSLAKHSRKQRNHNHRDFDYEAAAAIAKAFDILNTEAASAAASDLESSVAPSPMKTPVWRYLGKSPAVVRQLRITDSPFPIKEDEVADGGEVDKEAEEFIRRFYEQLRRQQTIGATPDYYRVRRG